MNSTISPAAPDLQRPRSKSKIVLWGGIAIVLAATGIGLFVFPKIQKGLQESRHAKTRLTQVLKLLSDKKFEEAYGLMSQKVHDAQTFSEFSKSLSELEAQYSEFQSLSQTGFRIVEKPGQPTAYYYSGTVTYVDGDTGDIEATIVKENGEWKVEYIYIAVDEERLVKFRGKQ